MGRSSKVDTPCVLWGGKIDGHGYGWVPSADRVYGERRAHRAVLAARIGRALSTEEYACHHCDTPACVNVDHLYVGTARSNIHDAIVRGRWHTTEDLARFGRGNLNVPKTVEHTRAVELSKLRGKVGTSVGVQFRAGRSRPWIVAKTTDNIRKQWTFDNLLDAAAFSISYTNKLLGYNV